uniref:Band 7 domain-containing protein n=1 Tax=viral metagenome TaxID=1070528 RepID=A0A6C0C848_9ZZZZ
MGCCCSCLDADEYVLLDYPNGKELKYGPGITCFCCANAEKHKFSRVNNDQYLEISHLIPDPSTNSLMEIIPGPELYKPNDPYCTISKLKPKIRLGIDEYILTKKVTGELKCIDGPTLYCPAPYEEFSNVAKKINLTVMQYIVVTDGTSGRRMIVSGPVMYTPKPLEKISNIEEKIILNDIDYIYITHTDAGIIDIVEGPTTFQPGPYDVVSSINKKTVLKNNEYVKIIDKNSGIIRVVRGPATIILKQYEKLNTEITETHEINDITAAYIFDTSTGNYELITQHGMFIPSATQDVKEIRKKILLEQNEAMVIIDKDGKYIIMKGNDKTSAFFLPPYCSILEQEWSNDSEKHSKKISKFDLRPQYMDFEFLIRTKDNVEIFLKLNFYWQIVNVEKMIQSTHNAPRDVCLHAQSEILSEISRVDMKEFMESFNEVVHKAISDDDDFYEIRGIKLIRVEITGRRCKDLDTEKNFQEIIQKKTDRIKNLEQQHGQNEVKLAEIQGHIEQERLTGQLVTVKNEYIRRENEKMGEAAGSKISNFIEHLPKNFTDKEKIAIYYDQQNTERVKDVTHSPNVTMYVTQNDLDIKVVNLNGDNDKKLRKNVGTMMALDDKKK